jgi:lambda repressor-like predicted transcriptional regulator
MHPADIKSALEKADSSQADISRRVNRSDVAVNHVIYGRSSSRLIAGEIAKVTGLSLDALWPGRYPSPDGKKVKNLTKTRQKHTPRRDSVQP